MEKVEELLEWGGMKKDITFLAISGVALLLSIFDVVKLPFDVAWIAIVLCGVPIILEAIIGLVTKFDIKADVLVSLALIASICIHENFAAGEVAFIMQLGGLLEDLTVARARAGIEKLVHLTPTFARRIVNGTEQMVDAKDVQIGDILKVLPGETIPVDGMILSGQTSINQAVMTGESLPVDKTVGDFVLSGTMNQFGSFEMEATKVGNDSSIQRMIRLVQSADANKAKVVRLADRWATWIVVTALTAALLTWIITGQIIRAVTILVVFCPCSLVLATPTAIMAAIGNATKHGFLVREGDALEKLAKVKKVTFDKTGTLTIGVPQVTKIQSFSDVYSIQDIYLYCASIEQSSEHPLGKAIVDCFRLETKEKLQKVSDFKMIPGKGVEGIVNGKLIDAGNNKLFENIEIDEEAKASIQQQRDKGETVILIAIDQVFVGYIALADSLREDSISMIQRLNALGVTPVLQTGDNEKVARQIAGEVGIQEVHANCLPEDKLQCIDTYQKNNEGVCMIGDGINDAPSLKKAEVGIAMGKIGSDIAVDAADIALIDDEIKELPHLFALSKKMMRKITFNLSFSMTLNFIAIVLAMTGILNPVIGALVHNAGSVFVIINSAFLLTYQGKEK